MVSERNLSIYAYTVLFIAMGFGTYLAKSQVTDPFLYYDVAFSKLVNIEGELVFPKLAPFSSLNLAPGRQIIMMQLINMMGIKPEVFQHLPLGTILLSLSLYILANELLDSPILSSLVTLYLAFNLSHATALYSVFAYALGFPLLLGFFLFCKNFLKHRNWRELPVILFLFTSLNFIHYTLAVWAVLFGIGASITIELQKRLSKNDTRNMKPVFYLSLAFIVFFLSYNETLYRSYIPFLAPETLESAIQRFLSFTVIPQTGTTVFFDTTYRFSRSSQINTISTLTLILILIIVLAGLSVDFWKLVIKRSKERLYDSLLPINWAILFLGFVDALIYSIRGSISTKSFSMLFPLIALSYCMRTKKRFIYTSVALVLLLTSLVKIPLFYVGSYIIRGNGSTTQSIQLSSDWLISQLGNKRYYILSDLNLYGKYLINSIEYGYTPLFKGYDDNLYKLVVEGDGDVTEYDYIDIVAIDKKSTQPTVGFIWNIYSPIRDYLDEIRNNKVLALVYEDEYVILARFINAKN